MCIMMFECIDYCYLLKIAKSIDNCYLLMIAIHYAKKVSLHLEKRL